MMGSSPYDAADSTGTIDGTQITVERYASYMAQTMQKDKVSITFEQTESFAPSHAEDLLPSGTYVLSAEKNSFSELSDSAHWHEELFIVDAETKTIHTLDLKNGAEKGTGTYEFDQEKNEYTLTYTAEPTRLTGIRLHSPVI